MIDLKQVNVAVVVASDSRSRGERRDETGPAARAALSAVGVENVLVKIVPDEKERLKETLTVLAQNPDISLILTAGGTGLAPRDVTPEATLSVVERIVPGIPELLRHESLRITPKAALSRGVAGVLNRTLIINLPGSPKAVAESVAILTPLLAHALETVLGLATECATSITS